MNTVTTMVDTTGQPSPLWLGDIAAIQKYAAENGKDPSELTQLEIRLVVFNYRDELINIETPSSLYPDATMHVSDGSKDPDDPMNRTHTSKVFGADGQSVQITKEGADPWKVFAGHLNLREDIPTGDARAAADLILAAVAEAERRNTAEGVQS